MRTILLLILSLLVLYSSNVNAQSILYLSDKSHCIIEGKISTNELNLFVPDIEILKIYNKIDSISSLPLNCRIFSTNNKDLFAIATVDPFDSSRLIVYSSYFVQSIEKNVANEWALIFVIAHEIGHHISGHTLKENGNRALEELTADYFGGFILGKLGATQKQADESLNFLTSLENKTYPSKNERLTQILKGWEKGMQLRKVELSFSPCDKSNSDMTVYNDSNQELIMKEITLQTGQIFPIFNNLNINANSGINIPKLPIGTHKLSYQYKNDLLKATTFTVNPCNTINKCTIKN